MRAKQRLEELLNKVYLEKIGDRIRFYDPKGLPDFELVEACFFLKQFGQELMPGASFKYRSAMMEHLERPGVVVNLIKQFNTPRALPVGFRYLDKIHGPMFDYLQGIAPMMKRGGRKSTRKHKVRRHRKKTRARK